MGFGTNIVTGDYSRGATGLWIENGQLTHAVEEVTIAGNLADMLMNITAIGNDLVFRGSVASPHPPHRRHDHRRSLIEGYGLFSPTLSQMRTLPQGIAAPRWNRSASEPGRPERGKAQRLTLDSF
jgi:hypothetical protein